MPIWYRGIDRMRRRRMPKWCYRSLAMGRLLEAAWRGGIEKERERERDRGDVNDGASAVDIYPITHSPNQ